MGPASSNQGDPGERGQSQRSVPAFGPPLHRIQTVSFPFNLPAFQGNLISQTCFLSRGETSAMQTMKIAACDKGLPAVRAGGPARMEKRDGAGGALAPLAATGVEKTPGLRMSGWPGPRASSNPHSGTQRPREGRDSPRGTQREGLTLRLCRFPSPAGGLSRLPSVRGRLCW